MFLFDAIFSSAPNSLLIRKRGLVRKGSRRLRIAKAPRTLEFLEKRCLLSLNTASFDFAPAHPFKHDAANVDRFFPSERTDQGTKQDHSRHQGSPSDPILFWNKVALKAALVDSRTESPTQAGPTETSRAMAIVHAAMYDAWNGVHREFTPYLVTRKAIRGTSGEAAVARAAHDTLADLYPLQKRVFDRALAEYLRSVPDGKSERLGLNYGRLVAERILVARSDDGSSEEMPYEAGTAPGQHRPDPLNPDQGFLTPGWGKVDPFAIPSVEAFGAPNFPELTSTEYAAMFDEVRAKGALDAEVSDRDGNGSPDRTDEETEIGIYWGYDHRLGSPVRLYNEFLRKIAVQEENTVSENARLFAMSHIAMADAAIAGWAVKYDQEIWRPVVAIREADTDGNPNTEAEADWIPLGAPGNFGDPRGFPGFKGPDANPDPLGGPDFTPPFPAYVSGHAILGGAVFQTLTDFYGTDKMTFRVRSDDSGTTRTFTRFSQAMTENSESRLFLGVHWRTDLVVGQAQGQAIGKFIATHFFQEL